MTIPQACMDTIFAYWSPSKEIAVRALEFKTRCSLLNGLEWTMGVLSGEEVVHNPEQE